MCAYTLASASLEVQEAGNRRRRAPLTPAVCQLAWTCDSSRVGFIGVAHFSLPDAGLLPDLPSACFAYGRQLHSVLCFLECHN